MVRRYTFLLLMLLTVVVTARAHTFAPGGTPIVLPADTTQYGEDDDEASVDTTARVKQNFAKKNNDMNALDYIMEDRYLPENEDYNRGFWKNTFIEAGFGAEKISNSGNGNYSINTLTQARLGLGKQLSTLSSVRLMLHGSWGYQDIFDRELLKFGARADYIYGLSSYMQGYNTARLVDFSAVVGLGYQYSTLDKTPHRDVAYTTRSAGSLEAHLGAQVKFYAGPQACLTIEPYIGLGSDAMSLSETSNWQGTNAFYGVMVNAIYYLDNHLSEMATLRLIADRDPDRNPLSTDSVLQSWQQPWFGQVYTGMAFMDAPTLSSTEGMGNEIGFSIGRWLSPVVGLRLSASTRNTKWYKLVSEPDVTVYRPSYTQYLHNAYQSMRAELMLNPLGFLPNYNWDSPYGCFLVGGAEMGWLTKEAPTESDLLSCSSSAYSLGMNIWYRLSDGLKVFIEPRYSHLSYKIPYTNVTWHKKYSDNNVSVNIGLTIESRDAKRFYTHSMTQEMVDDRLRPFAVGGALGFNLFQVSRSYDSGAGSLGLNGQVYGEYHFNRLSAARFTLEMASLKRSDMSDFIDYNGNVPEAGYAPVDRTGLFDHSYMLGLVSLSYMANLTHLARGYRGQMFELHGFVGPTLAKVLGRISTLSPQERLLEGHWTEAPDFKDDMKFGFHAGVKLEARIKPQLSLTLTPTFYLVNGLELPGMKFVKKMNFVETINIGAQYNF